jgi:hypothetical protein
MPADIAPELAQTRRVDRENALFDECALPDLFQQLALRDQTSRLRTRATKHHNSGGQHEYWEAAGGPKELSH